MVVLSAVWRGRDVKLDAEKLGEGIKSRAKELIGGHTP